MRVSEICNELNLTFKGKDRFVEGCVSINKLQKNKISFVKNKTFTVDFRDCILVAPEGYQAPSLITLIFSQNPKLSFSKIVDLLYPESKSDKNYQRLTNGALIESGAEIGENTSIGANCVISSCVKIGNNCTVGSGSILGEEGFGYQFDENHKPVKIRHIGGVSIGDDVEIGNNCCIDRGMLDDTSIGNSVKIDNLVHIAHNCFIDDGSIITACAELSGGVHVEKGAWIAPNSSVLQRVTIGKNATVGIGASVTEDVSPKQKVASVAAMPLRELALFRKNKKFRKNKN